MKIGYARISTHEQNPEMQVNALKEYGCEKIFLETVSGKTLNKPELNKVLEYLRPNDSLVIWKLSRLARSLKEIIKISENLSKQNVHLEILTQKIDTNTSEGKLFFHIMGAFDEFQRELIVENTREGLIQARREGRVGGRPKVINEKKKKVAEALIRDKKNYPFISDVIRELQISRTTFYRYFSSERILQLRQ